MSDEQRRWMVAWRSEVTGFHGHGEKVLSWEEAKAWCNEMNEKYPDLEHWPLLWDGSDPVPTPEEIKGRG